MGQETIGYHAMLRGGREQSTKGEEAFCSEDGTEEGARVSATKLAGRDVTCTGVDAGDKGEVKDWVR